MSFAREYPVKSVRKSHRCDGCGTTIEAGASAIRWAGMIDGDFGTAIYHPDCREAEIALNEQAGTWWGEWLNIGNDIETDDWPWLLADFPTVAERLGITQARLEERLAEQEACRRAFAARDSDTRPKAGDPTQIGAPLASGAVREAQSPNPLGSPHTLLEDEE